METLGTRFTAQSERRVWFSYEDIEELALRWRRIVLRTQYDGIVALARGGLYLATMLSQMTDIHHAVAYYDRSTRSTRFCNLPEPHEGSRVLLVEDIAGKGYTLVDVKSDLERLGFIVDTMVICWDAQSRITPAYGIRLADTERYVFPWERTQLAPTDPNRTQNDSDTANWITAFDLDGVFLQDLPPGDYKTDLEKTLMRRDCQTFLGLPEFWWQTIRPSGEGGIILSARLEEDRARTIDWLLRNNIIPSNLILRPSLEERSEDFKARIILEMGITEYIESDLTIAIHLAKQIPYLIVWHYDAETGESKRVLHS
jgi:hypoxanthine phosphoribosyltransferase